MGILLKGWYIILESVWPPVNLTSPGKEPQQPRWNNISIKQAAINLDSRAKEAIEQCRVGLCGLYDTDS